MSARVKKHCSILNYLKHADPDLHELIQELCIGKMLVPRRGAPGLAFLRPDKELLKKISDMANSDDDPEPAIIALQSCVILDHMPTVRDFDDKKNDIPTYRRKKLPVSGVDGKKITLKNGAEIVLDTKFQARKDRQNISVYVLSKALVPTDTDDADFSNAKPKNNRAVKGGAELAKTREGLFEQVLKEHREEKTMENRNPAMEMLLGLCTFLKLKEKKDELCAVTSQLSWDTLASLAIVLRPYATAKQDLYVSDDSIAEMSKSTMSNSAFSFYSLSRNPVDDYQSLMDSCEDNVMVDKLKNIQTNGARNMTRFTGGKTLSNMVGELGNLFQSLKRRESYSDCGLIAIAEAELRVASALLHDCKKNNNFVLEHDTAEQVYCKRFTLNEPYADCINPKIQKAHKPSVAEYFSQANLIARSDAIAYLPKLLTDDGGSINTNLTNEDAFIRLDYDLKKHHEEKKDTYASVMNDKLQIWNTIISHLKSKPD